MRLSGILKGIKRTTKYTSAYLRSLGMLSTLAYLISVILKMTLREKRFTLTDTIPVPLHTKYGWIVCTLEDLSVLWEIFCEKAYRFRERNVRFVIDIGAHVGFFTLYIKRLAPSAQVVAIEPAPIKF